MNTPTPSPLRVAIIGCGRPRGTGGATGFGMSHKHLAGFLASGRCELAAVVDLSRENAEAFLAQNASALSKPVQIFSDSLEMMKAVQPDIVSICLWPNLHADIVCALAPFKPRLIFCEKPMDIHWDASLRMDQACREHGVLLAINHQRRFNLPILKAKALLDGGEIGKLKSLEGAWASLADAGSHVLDMMFYFNQDTPADWVMGQIDMRSSFTIFGGIQAGHGLTEIRFQNGVRALYHFGHQHEELGCLLRLMGEDGLIEILFDEPWLRIRRAGQKDWEIVDTGESIHDDLGITRGIADVIRWLDTGEVSQLASEKALRTTEIIFATPESSRRRARVDLPLPSGPCAMLDMLRTGELKV